MHLAHHDPESSDKIPLLLSALLLLVLISLLLLYLFLVNGSVILFATGLFLE